MRNFTKTPLLFCLCIVFFTISCTTAEKEHEETTCLKGTWQLVSGEWTMQDTVIKFPGGDYAGLLSYKFIGKEHFVVVGQDTAMDMHYAQAGPYKVTGSTYVEYFEINKNLKKLGDSAVYQFTLEGDIWTINSDWLKEEWKRVE